MVLINMFRHVKKKRKREKEYKHIEKIQTSNNKHDTYFLF